MNDRAIGIVDEPNRGDQPDKLDIGRHATALTHFIRKSDTPITIGIQGEWGSGKTSLLNMIMGLQSPNSGKVVVGETIVLGHYHQLGGDFSEEWNNLKKKKKLLIEFRETTFQQQSQESELLHI